MREENIEVSFQAGCSADTHSKAKDECSQGIGSNIRNLQG